MYKYLLIFFIIIFSYSLNAQKKNTKGLPRYFTEGEEVLMRNYPGTLPEKTLSCITTAPEHAPRSMAEWEELQAVVITWTSYIQTLIEVVRYAKEEVEVIIICSDSAVVKTILSTAGIDWTTNVTFIEEQFNSIWIRDYGPNSVYLNDVESLAFVDWIYNRPRPYDDVISEVIATHLGLDVYCTTQPPTDIVHTGGNQMTDGMGTAFSSKLVLDENGPNNNWGFSNHSEEEVEQIMQDFMGIHTYVKMDKLLYDGIHHIDMHMKILDEERIMVGQYPDDISDGPQMEANIQFILNNFVTAYGNPYEIIRIPMPPENGFYPNSGGDFRTYTNAIFINKTVLVPTYEEQYDTTGLRIWEEVMPGYNIVGINCNQIIPAGGAIHCIAKEVGVAEPLLVNHQQIKSACIDEPIYFSAIFKHKSGIASAKVYYTSDLNAGFEYIDMVNSDNDNWEVNLAPLNEVTTVFYYFESTANNGKTIVRPLTAPEGYFDFPVKVCTVGTTEIETGSTKMLSVFPNPAAAITCIPVESKSAVAATLELTDILGKNIKTIFRGILPAGTSKYFIDATQLESGVYFISLKSGGVSLVQRVAVK